MCCCVSVTIRVVQSQGFIREVTLVSYYFGWIIVFLDHVAMVLRFDVPGEKDQDLFLIEATGNLGVRVKKWSALRDHLGKFYDRIVLRHLDFERGSDSLNNLEKFLKEVNGRNYSFRPK